jgi:phage terminase small subunit
VSADLLARAAGARLSLWLEGLGTLTEAEARAVVVAEGCAVAAAASGLKPRPEVRVMETARVQAARLLADFGLTPKGRRRLAMAPARGAFADNPDDPLRALLDGWPAFGPTSKKRH